MATNAGIRRPIVSDISSSILASGTLINSHPKPQAVAHHRPATSDPKSPFSTEQ